MNSNISVTDHGTASGEIGLVSPSTASFGYSTGLFFGTEQSPIGSEQPPREPKAAEAEKLLVVHGEVFRLVDASPPVIEDELASDTEPRQ